MERCLGQATMVLADHVNSWWGVELLISLLNIIIFVNFLCVDRCQHGGSGGNDSQNGIHCCRRAALIYELH